MQKAAASEEAAEASRARRLALKGKKCSCSKPRRQPQKEPSKSDAEAKRVEQELAAKVTQETGLEIDGGRAFCCIKQAAATKQRAQAQRS